MVALVTPSSTGIGFLRRSRARALAMRCVQGAGHLNGSTRVDFKRHFGPLPRDVSRRSTSTIAGAPVPAEAESCRYCWKPAFPVASVQPEDAHRDTALRCLYTQLTIAREGRLGQGQIPFLTRITRIDGSAVQQSPGKCYRPGCPAAIQRAGSIVPRLCDQLCAPRIGRRDRFPSKATCARSDRSRSVSSR